MRASLTVTAVALAVVGAAAGCSSSSGSSGDAGGGTDAPADAVINDGSPDSPTDAAAEGGCDDNSGPALVCTDAGTAACSLADDQCPELAAHLKSKVANAMYTCTANSMCMSGDFATCIMQTFAAACPDSSAATPCKMIVAACPDAGGITESVCEATLAPMTSSGRDAVVACLAGDGGSCSLSLCVQLAL
jgi:hypothetical protein